MQNPYQTLPPRAFWRSAISDKNFLEIADLWKPKLKLGLEDPIATFGSCFAQHIGRALAANGYRWLDAEPAPSLTSDALRKKYNYGVFSARTANIYTSKSLLQWLSWAHGLEDVPSEIWRDGENYIDPFRPTIEPGGFASRAELEDSRRRTFRAIRHIVQNCRLFVFTLGLTEAWENRDEGYVYASCPGTAGGEFDPERHIFVNYSFNEVHESLVQSFDIIRSINPEMQFLLTVSPVPLTATAANDHVLVSTTYSKSVLRAVAGSVVDAHDDVDYFPSYEIITGTPFRGMFYEPNQRSVASEGVAFVMKHFFAGLQPQDAESQARPANKTQASRKLPPATKEDLVCEEEMLGEFAAT